MKIRKLLFSLLAVCLVLVLLPGRASAETIDGGYCDANDQVIWTVDSDGTLTVSGTGVMDDFYEYSVDSNGDYVLFRYWNDWAGVVTRVVIEEGVTYVGANAFLDFPFVEEVVLADSVERIGMRAFQNCDSLTTIVWGDGLVETGLQAFYDCDALAKLVLPDYHVEYGDDIFGHCDSLADVTISGAQQYIAEGMFSDCTALEQIEIPNSVTYINYTAFPAVLA